MPLYRLCYRHNNSIFVVIEPAHSLIYARLRAAVDGLDEGEFTEGHELPGKWKVPKEMVGRRLSQEEAKTDHQLLLNCQLAHYRAGFKVVVRFKDEAVVLAFWNFLDDARSKIECVVVRCVRWPQGHEDPEDDDADYRHQN